VTADGGYCELLYDFTGSDNEGLGVFTGGYIATEDTTVTLEIIKDDGVFADLSSKIITDGEFHLIGGNPLAKGSTGIKITGNNGDVINVDEASIQLGSFSQVASSNCTSDLDCENIFSAAVEGVGTVIESKYDWIDGNCTNADPRVCTFNTGIFTVAPNCWVEVRENSDGRSTTAISTATTVSFRTVNDNVSATQNAASLFCKKTGTDSKSLREQGALLSPGSAGARLGVYTASGSNISLSSTATTVTFADELFSKYITWDNSAHEATVQKSGTYDIFVTLNFFDQDSNSTYSYFVEVDSGSGFSQPANTQTGSGYTRDNASESSTVANKFLVDLKAGDKFRVRATSTAPSIIIYDVRAPTMTVTPVPTIDQMAAEIQGASADRYCFVRDVKSSGTNGGTSSTTPVKRDLTETQGVCDYLTLADSTMTLQPGTYKISWSAPAFKAGAHQTALRDATAGAYVQMGSSEYANNNDSSTSTSSVGTHVVTITAENDYEIFHEVGTAQSGNGWGTPTGGSLSITTEEIYTQVEVEKLK
jgi:hypothetical protein